ncbi:hypothetical protein GQ600_3952 [Phytophthora cactorum]|nr:hypothetical protein GQ600_3952 [Phytophthora cactorum]
MEAVEIFSGANCAGTPDVLAMYNVTTGCVEDAFAHTKQVFGDFTYVIMETYDNKSCTSFGEADVFLASGGCEISSGFGDQSAITSLFSNGSAVVELYPDNACGGEPSLYFELDKAALKYGYQPRKRSGSTSNFGTSDPQVESSTTGSDDSLNDSSMGTGVILGIVAAGLVFVLIMSLVVAHHLRRKHEAEMEEEDNFSEFLSPRIGLKNATLTAPGTLESHLDDGQRESQKPLSLVGYGTMKSSLQLGSLVRKSSFSEP